MVSDMIQDFKTSRFLFSPSNSKLQSIETIYTLCTIYSEKVSYTL